MVTNTTTSTMDWEIIETQKERRALLSGGYQYFRIIKIIEGQEFRQHCLWRIAREEGSADQKENVSRTSTNMASTIRDDK